MAVRPNNNENLMSLADQLVWAISTYGGGGGVSASTTLTVAAGATSQSWNHAQNTSDIACVPTKEPRCFWWVVIDDADNITVWLASPQMGYTTTFRVLSF